MGNYSYDDHVDLFGGPPEPGEGVDWREWADLERKARKEDGDWIVRDEVVRMDKETLRAAARIGGAGRVVTITTARRPWWRRWRRGA